MQPGTRVLITKASSAFLLGTVVRDEGGNCLVALDIKPFKLDQFVNIPANLLVPVNYWLMQTTRTKYNSIPHENEYDPLTYFLNKGNAKFDMALVRATWCWTNEKLFNNKLKRYPSFVNSTKTPANMKGKIGKLYGLFTANNPPEIMIKLNAMISVYMCFNVTVHEMVHQMTWEAGEPVDHGPYFMKWVQPVKSICKINLNQYADLSYKDVVFKKEDLNEETTKEFYVLMILHEGVYKAIAGNNLSVLEAIRDFYTIHYTTYLRKMRNARLKKILKFQTTVSKKVTGWESLPEDLSDLIINEGEKVYSRELVV